MLPTACRRKLLTVSFSLFVGEGPPPSRKSFEFARPPGELSAVVLEAAGAPDDDAPHTRHNFKFNVPANGPPSLPAPRRGGDRNKFKFAPPAGAAAAASGRSDAISSPFKFAPPSGGNGDTTPRSSRGSGDGAHGTRRSGTGDGQLSFAFDPPTCPDDAPAAAFAFDPPTDAGDAPAAAFAFDPPTEADDAPAAAFAFEAPTDADDAPAAAFAFEAPTGTVDAAAATFAFAAPVSHGSVLGRANPGGAAVSAVATTAAAAAADFKFDQPTDAPAPGASATEFKFSQPNSLAIIAPTRPSVSSQAAALFQFDPPEAQQSAAAVAAAVDSFKFSTPVPAGEDTALFTCPPAVKRDPNETAAPTAAVAAALAQFRFSKPAPEVWSAQQALRVTPAVPPGGSKMVCINAASGFGGFSLEVRPTPPLFLMFRASGSRLAACCAALAPPRHS